MSLNCEQIKPDETVAIIDATIQEKSLVSHHIDSFNSFINGGINQIVTQLFKAEDTINPERAKTKEDRDIKTIKFQVTFDNIWFEKPVYSTRAAGKESPLLPHQARRENLNYSSTIFVDATITAQAFPASGGEPIKRGPESVKGYKIGQIPMMVGSERCHTDKMTRSQRAQILEDPSDSGGYFILKGGEWSIRLIESRLFNYPNVFRNVGHQKEICRLEFLSKPGDYFENSSEMKIRYLNTGHIYINFTSDKRYLNNIDIPFHVLFKLLGMTTDKEICDNIVYNYSTKSNPDEMSEYIMQRLKKAFAATDQLFSDARNITDQTKMLQLLVDAVIKGNNMTKPESAKKYDESTKLYLEENLMEKFDKLTLPHIGFSPGSRHEKLRYLGHLINRLFLVEMQIVESTDRDSLKTKRVYAAGGSYAKTFKRDFNMTVVNDIKKKFKNEFKTSSFNQVNLVQTFKNSITGGGKLEKQINTAIVTGNKEIQASGNKTVPNRLASEVLHRKNEVDFTSAMRVISVPTSSSSRQDQRADEMRRAHSSYLGYICLVQSAPTGSAVGMVKQLALGATISLSTVSEILKSKLRSDPDVVVLSRIFPHHIGERKLTKIMVNGDWIGCSENAGNLATRYREMRRGFVADSRNPGDVSKFEAAKSESDKEINSDCTIYWDFGANEINFWLDSGRPLRPLLVVRNNSAEDPIGQRLLASRYDEKKDSGFRQDIVLTRDMIRKIQRKELGITELQLAGVVDFVSSDELENCYVAESLKKLAAEKHNSLRRFTHCEIPQSMLGIPALTCPRASHNQVPRVVFQTNQTKQTCSYYSLSWQHRVDKHGILQYYCEAPVVSTIANKYIRPNGCNTVVAILSYGGYNQEDSLIFNKAAANRGLFKVQVFDYYKSSLDQQEKFGSPVQGSTIGIKKRANYEHLVDGIPRIGEVLRKNDVVIGKLESESQGGGRSREREVYSDVSVIYHSSEDGLVEDVVRAVDQDGNEICKVKVSHQRELGIGDKFSSRHGQKGVNGVGYSAGEMPFTSSGLVPDLIVNPHAIPSRMTIGQLMEGRDSKLHSMLGTTTDATIFKESDDESVGEQLEKLGFDRYGRERLFNGMTGEWVDAMIYMTPVYYQRLQKFAVESMYSVSTGPTDMITRQPLEGKSNKGGLRIGEMEKDVIISHGAGRFIAEKFVDDSDGFDVYVCRNCGQMPVVNEEENRIFCKSCEVDGEKPKVVKVKSTWSSKLFLQELESMGVAVTMRVNPYEYETKE
jgi:DNA-directed RNA polymerase II subunit RPB2